MTNQPTFLGYHRADGSVGVRNHMLVLSVGGLTIPTARRIAASIKGAVIVGFPYNAGSLLGEDRATWKRAMLAMAVHPNVGAVLLVGDNPPVAAEVAEHARKAGRPHAVMTLDDCNHDAVTLTERGIRAGARMAMAISVDRRAPAPLSALTLGLECGRSDPSSGLVSNPLLGRMADRMVDGGGRAMIGETVEWLGAEHRLEKRAATPEVAKAIRDAVLRREQWAISHGLDLTGNNPGPANIAGGLSSIEEKALGNIAKSGSRPIQGVLKYGEAAPKPGCWVMDAPAYASESLTGFTAAGAQLMLFTTGVGNSFVSALAPTIKVCANPETCARVGEQLDLDAHKVFTGEETPESAADRLWVRMMQVADGAATWGEILGEGDEIVARYGQAM
ncbi:MAG: UxaA family hydrolase [Rhodospirillaceae bacterium]|nr:UxaA family hydrolase [Rhodospirillaceae bacterium]